MLTYIVRRLFILVVVVLAVTIIAFSMVHLIPGNPAQIMAGINASPEDVKMMSKKLGLNKPLYIQYIDYMNGLLHGDFGTSIRTGRSVAHQLLTRYPATFELAVVSIFIALSVSIIGGVTAATHHNTFIDNLTMLGALFGVSMPSFWRGLMLMFLFSLLLGWLPVSGRGDPYTLEWLRHLILPSVALGVGSAAYLVRLVRSNMLEILNEEYIKTARSKGLRETFVIYRHALKNAFIPIVTMAGMQFGYLLGGTVVIETVFAWPGLGRLMINSIFARDFPSIQGAVLMLAVSFALVNLIVDLTYAFLDPRIRYS
ncbi:ABC transporter permease [Candidatus Bipolaricaulota bacterium]|nr:ABC transporter permease [Candidatus Bipolaricaulota bacterium]